MGVQLEEMLLSRERRADFQQELLKEYKMTLICLTMNIAGEQKRFKNADSLFYDGVRLIGAQLSRCRIEPAFSRVCDYSTGLEGYWVVDFAPEKIKAMMVQIEDAFDAARLFDIDVLTPDNEKLSRQNMGALPRRCLICGDAAADCARSRRHGLDAIERQTKWLLADYADGAAADRIARLAVKSLLTEVCITPKPGLVDCANAGAHRDMDIFTFVDSAAALIAYFKACGLKGMRNKELSPAQLFASLRYIGQCAEDDMFAATGGVNTHKGAIYSMGIVCAAAGRLSGTERLTPEQLCLFCAEMTADETKRDFERIEANGARTSGEKIWLRHGIAGIRGEAATGFINVRRTGLPVLKELLAKGHGINSAGAITLLHLMANAVDTNVISRAGLARQQALQAAISELLEKTPSPDLEQIRQLDEELIAENISPGGCADLLAITFMLHFLCE